MKTLAVALLFNLLAGASLYAQTESDVNALGYRRYHFNDFVVNGTFHHNVTLIAVKDGVAELNSKEGRVSTPWSSLPIAFQNENAGLTTKYAFPPENYPDGDKIEWSGINGKMYHDVEFKGYRSGVAQIKTREGIVLLPWEQLPSEFQRKYARVRTIQDANEARGRVEAESIANAKTANPLNVFVGLTADETLSHLNLIGIKGTLSIGGHLYKMQEGKPYPVVGLTPSNSLIVATEYGTTVFPASNWKYELEAGNSVNAPAIFLKDAKATGAVNQSTPAKSDDYSSLQSLRGDGRPAYFVSYSCDLISAEPLSQVYAVCLWLKDDKIVAIDFQTVGTLTADKPDSLFLGHSVPLSQRNDDLSYQIHVYSGRLELKKVEQATGLKVLPAATPMKKIVGASLEEVTKALGYPVGPVGDNNFEGSAGYQFRLQPTTGSSGLLLTASFKWGMCYSATYHKDAGKQQSSQISSQEITQWMLAYSKESGSQWKQAEPKKWTLECVGAVPPKYHAEWPTPDTFTIQIQENVVSRYVDEHQTSEEALIPGLPPAPARKADGN